MSEGIVVALISLTGTLIGTFTGIITAGRLNSYRLEQLEKKIEKLGELVDRIYALEKRTSLDEEKLKTMDIRINRQENSVLH